MRHGYAVDRVPHPIPVKARQGHTKPASSCSGASGVEEAALVETLGWPYEIYRTHTKRLVPGLW